MSIEIQAAVGLAMLALGWMLSTWAAQYNVKSWLTDAAWRFLFRRGWKDAGKANIQDVLDHDGKLQRLIGNKADAFKADAARLGRTRATAKHGFLFAIAYAVNLVALPILLIGIAVLAHVAWRWTH